MKTDTVHTCVEQTRYISTAQDTTVVTRFFDENSFFISLDLKKISASNDN